MSAPPPGPSPPPTKLVGRAGDLAALAARLQTDRAITILGPPGVGKSRLALELAVRHARSGGDACVCDLTEAREAEDALASVARALDVTNAGDVAGVIAGRGRILLVLDNLEQLSDAAVTTIGAWLDAAPQARIVATSRRRLSLPGEVLIDLAPLPLPEPGQSIRSSEAVQLFVERARMAWSDYVLEERDEAAVAAIVRELDGLPLAIELCAARIRVLSPEQMLAQLGQRFRLLAESATALRGPSGVKRALRDAIDASWEQLAEPERSALAQSAVFGGGFTLEAAEAVILPGGEGARDGAPWVLDVLHAIVDRSLLTASSEPAGGRRFKAYVSIRDYAAERLTESPELEAAAMRRHARYFLTGAEARIEALDGPAARETLDWLTREADNLAAIHARATRARSGSTVLEATDGVRAALVLARLLAARGPFSAGLRFVDEAIEAAKRSGAELPPALLGGALLARARLLRLSGRIVEALAAATEARGIAERSAERALLGRALHDLGRTQLVALRIQDALASLEQALAIEKELGDATTQARILGHLAQAELHADHLVEARARYVEALGLQRRAGNRIEEGVLTARLAMVEMELGHPSEAAHLFSVALEIHREVGDRTNEMNTLTFRGVAEQDAGELDDARRTYEQTLPLTRELGEQTQEGILLGYLGTCLHELGDRDGAVQELDAAVRRLDLAGVPVIAALFRACRAAVAASQDESGRAASLLGEAEAELARAADPVFFAAAVPLHRGHLDLALARSSARKGDAAAAATHRRSARERLEAGRRLEHPQSEVRFALRSLERALQDEPLALAGGGDATRPDALVIGARGSWFRPPNGEVVDLARRKPLKRLVAELARRRRVEPGAILLPAVLVAIAWPDEQLTVANGTNRLRVALSELRKLGLGASLLTREGGYCLDPSVPLELGVDRR